MSSKTPSEGTKVTVGRNAPVTNEGPGLVAEQSLAAESQSFLQANQAVPRQIPQENMTSASKSHEGGIHQAAPGTNASLGPGRTATAPSYVQSQYMKDRKGPQGKNLTEDDSIGTEDKSKNVSFSEFGTKNDPGRSAEQKFTFANTANTGSTSGREKDVDAKQPYEVLDPNVDA
ncbi:hypothetical protein F4804DRAFT_316578 [Jackrogersella minutella]|nr:hypothetical protein F4804DRAFT_316578 [Jackrogersella minutella]